jgi:ubiquinone/menaquinone biosynthesis C-methylase UbiE
MPIFRKDQGKHTLAVAMTAVKMGDRFLQIGCTDAALLAAIASKVGLSGRACVAVESEAGAARSRAGAAQSGMLLEVEVTPFGQLPYDDKSFDVIVIDSLDGLIAHASPEGQIGRASCRERV